MTSNQNHIYSSLNPTKHEIRILALHPGSFSSALSCSLLLTTLTTPVSYEALSYTWGIQYSSCKLLVNRGELAITANLETALRHLRRQDKDRILWIDAICINQAKDATEERNDQVQKMRLPYEKAERVIAWLGSVEESGELIVDLVEHLKADGISQGAVEASLRNPADLPRWKALFEICGMDYWYRVWILQEIVCASKAMLKVGKYEIAWGGHRLDWKEVRRRLWNTTAITRDAGSQTKPSFCSPQPPSPGLGRQTATSSRSPPHGQTL